jgi:phosphoribosylaminoimidazolecarboxamide formyltransferase/IMP cyclohydrolase
MQRVRRALLSVSDKTALVELARRLSAQRFEILSTGGTARALRDAGINVTEVADYTGFPEIMDGRVKTLHPRIHAALLARRGVDDATLAELGIDPIDILVVNLYPFRDTIGRAGSTLAQAVENIDVGGPAMLRAAAKNHDSLAVVVDPADYARVATEIEAQGSVSEPTRRALAVKAFQHTADYDHAIAEYLHRQYLTSSEEVFPRQLRLDIEKAYDLRYGENPHQRAAFYVERERRPGTVAAAQLIQGKELSFNNLGDADAALAVVREFDTPACAIVKHANPCGVALGDDLAGAYRRAYSADPKSAYGGVIAFNRPLDARVAQEVLDRQFVEVIVAPAVADDARAVLERKRNVRVLATGDWNAAPATVALDYRRVASGLLVQEVDGAVVSAAEIEVVTKRAPSAAELEDLLFAWRVVKHVKSNAIVLAKDAMTVGIGAGQMSRVWSTRIAALKGNEAALPVAGSVLASDAFFPFRDGVDDAAEAGAVAVIQPGGSVRDDEVIAAANEHGIAMVFTRVRHFRH